MPRQKIKDALYLMLLSKQRNTRSSLSEICDQSKTCATRPSPGYLLFQLGRLLAGGLKLQIWKTMRFCHSGSFQQFQASSERWFADLNPDKDIQPLDEVFQRGTHAALILGTSR